MGDEGRYTRKRIPLEEAVEVAGDGNPEMGRRVVELLSGGRPKDTPEDVHRHALRLIMTQLEGRRELPGPSGAPTPATYVDLIHETLIRTTDKDATGKPRPYWPTLYEFVEANRDRDVYLQQLEMQTERWQASGWFGRWWNIASWRERRLYRKLRIGKCSPQGRFLFFSRWMMRAQLTLLALVLGYIAEAYIWTAKHSLPPESMITLQRFRFGYAPVPEMVSIRSGLFKMGEEEKRFVEKYSAQDEYGAHVRQYLGIPSVDVEIGKGFSLGKYEVTYEQFDYYVWMQHRAGHPAVKFPTTAKGGRGLRPVVNVTRFEANDYAKWLGKRRHESCRLPTEAEWEYAARGGTNTAYPWGDEVGQNNANCNSCGSLWDNDQSAPVGSFPPNAFGLHDVSGNVWEWTCSAWRREFDGHERSCARNGEPEDGVVRGGSFVGDPLYAHSAGRDSRNRIDRVDRVGLRVLCSSPLE